MATTIERNEQAELDATLDLPVETEVAEAPEEDEREPQWRALTIAAAASSAAALTTGGIFGSWPARLIAVAGALLGVGFAAAALRVTRRLAVQMAIIPTMLLLGALTLVTTTEGPSEMFTLMSEAISSGRLLRPPVPFDPGWRPILLLLFSSVGLATAWVATAGRKPQLALVLPIPIVMLTAITQPKEGEFLTAVLAFVPILLAVGLLFGGDSARVSELGRAFELKRLVRAAPLPIIGILLLGLLARTDVLFPPPRYNPAEKPQKPKAVPLGQVRDRVLFEVAGDLTGPWKTGVLDFYDGESWRLPPYDPGTFDDLPRDGVVDEDRTGDVTVTLTMADLGTTSVIPGVVDPTTLKVIAGERDGIVYDPRAGVFRMETGRVPAGLVIETSLPKYPTTEQLKNARPLSTDINEDLTYIPKPPPAVKLLLEQAPENPWLRLDSLRSELNKVVIAAGAGVPSKPVPPSKVDDLLVGSHEGTPFEIVAAEAMLARWAGIPSRIGFGFDGVLEEDGKRVVRPKLGSNWLEVFFEGYGWIPLVDVPQQAQSTLDADPNAKFDPTITPSDDVAVEVYLPFVPENLRQLYEQVRRIVLVVLPILAAMLVVYLALPSLYRMRRRRSRRAWATTQTPKQRIAVEYCELRDAATDLNVGHPHATPLEYLQHLADDTWHEELAWLVTRATYGDLRDGGLTDDDADQAERIATSLKKRLFGAQPTQSRVLAAMSRASLREPYSTEVPNLRMAASFLPRPRRRRAWRLRFRLPRRLALRRRTA